MSARQATERDERDRVLRRSCGSRVSYKGRSILRILSRKAICWGTRAFHASLEDDVEFPHVYVRAGHIRFPMRDLLML
jgi:hypothetical protein